MKRSPLPPRQSPMARSRSLTRAAFRSRRKARTPEEVEARRVVRQRSGGTCEVCGHARATNFQHRQGKAQMGAWTAQNGLDVCGMGNVSGCHGHIHQFPGEAYELGWSVRSGHDPAATPVLIHGRRLVLLAADGTYQPIERKTA